LEFKGLISDFLFTKAAAIQAPHYNEYPLPLSWLDGNCNAILQMTHKASLLRSIARKLEIINTY
jgi:hypothetical protein